MDISTTLALGAIGLVAAIVNGAIGYGFSSITVPFALLFLASRVLNPALVRSQFEALEMPTVEERTTVIDG